MSNLKQFLHGAYKSAAESILPTLQKSAFEEKGVLTPDEFLLSGDFLTMQCKSWQWASCNDPRKAKSYLPPNKQYLITRNVPCFRRASALASYGDLDEFIVEANAEDTEGWVTAHPSRVNDDNDGFEHISSPPPSSPFQPSTTRSSSAMHQHTPSIPDISSPSIPTQQQGEEEEEEDIPDIGELDLAADDENEDDEAVLHPNTTKPSSVLPTTNNSNDIIKTRRYDLLITYDKYYQVPRFWLIGYDEEGCPLPPSAILEDVSSDHAKKTATIEPHPFPSSLLSSSGVASSGSTTTTTSTTAAVVSIHPCKHAEVMHKLTGVVAGKDGTFQVEHYLLLFTKFIASVIPTIQYDFTMAAGKASTA